MSRLFTSPWRVLSRGYLAITLKRLTRRIRGLPLTPTKLEAAACLLGDLNRWGWATSLGRGPTIGGEEVPWITYPAIVWMWDLLTGAEQVLELGAGSSTTWFARRSARVVSLEHSPLWYNQLVESKPANVELIFLDASDTAAYLREVCSACERYGPFTVILVDGGPDRVSATVETSSHLQHGGLLLLDDSHVSDYQGAVSFLADAGFQRLDFFGPSPGSRYLSCTSVFSRDLGSWFRRRRGYVRPVPFYENPDSPFRSYES
jgi:hypothetical protein